MECYVSEINIKEANVEDSALILRFVKDLARYEKAEHEVMATQSDIERSLFGPNSKTNAVICSVNGEPVGFAVYFYNYSTWLGKNGLYLEDLYVSPEHRSVGAGKALLKYLAKIAVSNQCGRFEWSVLDWNEPAIKFYQSIGAKPQNEWVGYRLTGNALENFANS
ncbi:GNAT family N-acetyltransferase [Thalassotalea nanhaiensis]|uniref:GNAT family N-acetyltransferase n=1 Tax=Thalassotalea nanhaiensis TaxID=3065648 RepID=UPI0038632A12